MSEETLFYQEEPAGEVLQQVASQLRLSLANIHSALSRLAPPEARDGEERIDLNAAVLCQSYYRILRIANNLADASEPPRRVGKGLRNEDIVALCREVAGRAEGPAGLLGITVEFRCSKERQFIAVDRDRIERLLLNLLSNAFKFMGAGEKKVTVTVRVEPEFVHVTVADTGRGIPEDQLPTLFERCRQPGRMEPPPHGLGLGLGVCKRIAEEHGGSMRPLSVAGKGTAMTFSLPNRKAPVSMKDRQILVEPAGGFNRTLVELSDVLPKQAFTQKYLD